MLFPLFRKKWQLTLAAAMIGMATHGFLDACTSYGTVLFWPWSDKRISWDIIAIIDPLFTIILKYPLTPGQKEDIAIFSWFTDHYLIIAHNDPLYLGDGRYTGRNKVPLISLWSIQLKPNEQHVIKYGVIKINQSCTIK